MAKHYKIEKTFTHQDKECVVIFTRMGHRCGYVSVKKDSPLHSIDYTDIPWQDIDVHGGLTYSGGRCYPVTRDYSPWWFGFDCAHISDGKDLALAREYFNIKAEDQYQSIFGASGTVRSIDYVINECKHLAEQLTKLEQKENTHDD